LMHHRYIVPPLVQVAGSDAKVNVLPLVIVVVVVYGPPLSSDVPVPVMPTFVPIGQKAFCNEVPVKVGVPGIPVAVIALEPIVVSPPRAQIKSPPATETVGAVAQFGHDTFTLPLVPDPDSGAEVVTPVIVPAFCVSGTPPATAPLPLTREPPV
jgi:hypothetical protein